MNLQVPDELGYLSVVCRVTDEGGLSDSAMIIVEIVEKINYPPEIESIVADERILDPGNSTSVTCFASDPNGDELTYLWTVTSGTISGEGSTIDFIAPDEVNNIYLVCEVADTDEVSTKDSLLILVRDPGQGQTGELVAHYEFKDNANDITGNGHDGSVSNCIYTEDMFGIEKSAIKFNISSSKVIVSNSDDLNFQDGLTVSYWININEYFEHESYPISHGNWTTRWKTSLTEQRLRFTLNGSNGTIDVDSDTKLEQDKWMHITAIYNGIDCLVFIDGELSGFKPYEGKINKTSYDLVLGQSLPDQGGFNYSGNMDKLRIYNYGISYLDVKEIYESELSSIFNQEMADDKLLVYPNPAHDVVYVEFVDSPNQVFHVSMYSIAGKLLNKMSAISNSNGTLGVTFNTRDLQAGTYLIKIENEQKVATRSVVVY